MFCFGLWGLLVDYSRFPNIQSKTECMLEHGGFLARGREKEACGSGSFHLASLSKAQDPQHCDFNLSKRQNYSNSQCCLDATAITK